MVVNKTVSLIREDRETTTIDGNYTNAMNVTANNVTIQGFTILGHFVSFFGGIYLKNTNNCVVTNNTIKDNKIGIDIERSLNNIIFGNIITKKRKIGV